MEEIMKYAILARVTMFFALAGLIVLDVRGAFGVGVASWEMKQAVKRTPEGVSAVDETRVAAQAISAAELHQAKSPTANSSDQPHVASISEIVSALDSSFSEQQTDAGWSRSAEEQVRTLFLPLTNKETNLISAVCRSTLCRVEFLNGTGADFYQFMNKLKNGGVLPGWKGQVVGGRIAARGDGTVRSVFYLGKEGSNLPLGAPTGEVR
jgi:hypothetical protein